MSKANAQKINALYLESVLKKKGVSKSEASKMIGRSVNYISGVCTNEKMFQNTAEFFCKTFGADVDKLIVREDPEQELREPPVPIADAATITALANALIAIDKKIDIIMRELGVCQCGQKNR